MNIDKISNKIYFEGVENYIDYIYDTDEKSLFSYLNKDAVVFLSDIARFKEKFENLSNTFKENYKVNLERGLALKGQAELLYSYHDIEHLLKDKKLILNTLLPKAVSHFSVKKIINFECREIPTFNAKIESLVEELNNLKYNGHKVILATNTIDRAEKLKESLFERGIEANVSNNRDIEIKSSQIIITQGNISRGFQYKSIKFTIITDNEMIGVHRRTSKPKKKSNKKGQTIESFLDLNKGDYVVHENNGIGRYAGIDQITVNAIKKDYMKIVYRGGDNL